MFDSFGIAEELLREAYHVLEVTFWSSDGGGIVRSSRAKDREEGVSHMPHVILNQARINELLLERMMEWNGQRVDYGFEVKGVSVLSGDATGEEEFPVRIETVRQGREEFWRAKYALVRLSQLLKLIFDASARLICDRHATVLTVQSANRWASRC